MPSILHETLLDLFSSQMGLAPQVLERGLKREVPKHARITQESADFTDIEPAEYRTDRVFVLRDEQNRPLLGIVLEVQLRPKKRKRYSWPVYVAGLRARLQCPVCLMVVTPIEKTARWARAPIDMGWGNCCTPWVPGVEHIPEVVDESTARSAPGLAILSALVHARNPDPAKAAQIGYMGYIAAHQLDEDKARMYADLILRAMPAFAREALLKMDAAHYQYKSDFARQYVMQGLQEGHSSLVLRQLAIRYGDLSAEVMACLKDAPVEELQGVAERLLAAPTLELALGERLTAEARGRHAGNGQGVEPTAKDTPKTGE